MNLRILLAAMIAASMCSPAFSAVVTFGTGANQFGIEFVTVGNPGNPRDTSGKSSMPGSVDYVYQIGKYEISRDMITKANSLAGLGITLDSMINYGGTRPNMPATGTSWFEAAKFVNWLNTSKGYAAAYKFDANGDFQQWSPGDVGYDASNPMRNNMANFVIPSESEWHKAAYYDPAANRYNIYATGSDIPPTAVLSGTAENTAVFGQSLPLPYAGPADITLAGGLSSYGTMGQGGNVWEWNETIRQESTPYRYVTGGSFRDILPVIENGTNSALPPDREVREIGFRIASLSAVPEPNALSIGLFFFRLDTMETEVSATEPRNAGCIRFLLVHTVDLRGSGSSPA